MTDGLAVAKRARVDLRELALDPARPFRVQAAPALPERRRLQIRASFRGAGGDGLTDAQRAPLAAALMRVLDDAAWDRLLTETVAARAAAGATWLEEPWALWAGVLEAEDERRLAARPVRITQAQMDDEIGRRATERGKLLALLRAAGPKGVLNTDIEAGEIGRRYSARLEELRKAGYAIDTERLSQRQYRFVLRSKEAA